MVEERDLNILKKSIQMLNAFSKKIESVNSGREFIAIHNRNLITIQKIANERNSEYLNKKLKEYPKLNAQEIDDYIRTNKKEVSFLIFVFTYFWYFIVDRLVRMIKTKGSTPEMIKAKILKVEKVNTEILNVIENPYLEEVYKTI
jgi:hypothetical protein